MSWACRLKASARRWQPEHWAVVLVTRLGEPGVLQGRGALPGLTERPELDGDVLLGVAVRTGQLLVVQVHPSGVDLQQHSTTVSALGIAGQRTESEQWMRAPT